MTTDARIRKMVEENARLKVDVQQLGDDDDLFDAGMSSHGSVNLMIAIEEEFDVTFPDEMIRHATFHSIANLRNAIEQLTGAATEPADVHPAAIAADQSGGSRPKWAP